MLKLLDVGVETELKMSEFVRICAKAELPPSGDAREFTSGEKVICIANDRGEIAAMDNACPHRGGPLGQGLVENSKMVCPWHAWAFDLKTGEAAHSPQVRAEMYEVKVDGDDVLVKL
jgi:nitrite reductase (NADH) small subunit